MAQAIGQGTAQGSIEYLASLVDKGRVRDPVVAPLKTAIRKVLQVAEGPDWQHVDVRGYDVADAMARFRTLTLGEYSSESYRTYESRIGRALGWYNKFLETPGWFPSENQQNRETRHKSGDKTGGKPKPAEAQGGTTSGDSRQYPPVAASSRLTPMQHPQDAIVYPFPLSGGGIATLHVPRTLSRADVKRMSAFLEALVVEEGGGL